MPITSNSVLPPLLTLTPMLTSVLTPYLKSATVEKEDCVLYCGSIHFLGSTGRICENISCVHNYLYVISITLHLQGNALQLLLLILVLNDKIYHVSLLYDTNIGIGTLHT